MSFRSERSSTESNGLHVFTDFTLVSVILRKCGKSATDKQLLNLKTSSNGALDLHPQRSHQSSNLLSLLMVWGLSKPQGYRERLLSFMSWSCFLGRGEGGKVRTVTPFLCGHISATATYVLWWQGRYKCLLCTERQENQSWEVPELIPNAKMKRKGF